MSRGQDYKLFWPERGEFVRLAVDSGAVIVPFSAVGIADRWVLFGWGQKATYLVHGNNPVHIDSAF